MTMKQQMLAMLRKRSPREQLDTIEFFLEIAMVIYRENGLPVDACERFQRHVQERVARSLN